MIRMSQKMAVIRHKLRWSAGSEWSATVSPDEAQVLLALIEDYYDRLPPTISRVSRAAPSGIHAATVPAGLGEHAT